MREEWHSRGAACPDWAWPGKQAGWVGSVAVEDQGRGSEQAPAISSGACYQPGWLSFAVSARQTERPRRRGLHHTRPQSESPELTPAGNLGLFRKDHCKATCLHSFIHPLSKHLVTPCHVPGSLPALGYSSEDRASLHGAETTHKKYTSLQGGRQDAGGAARPEVRARGPVRSAPLHQGCKLPGPDLTRLVGSSEGHVQGKAGI